ncbi:RELN-like protein, partial [Mya arenaria]
VILYLLFYFGPVTFSPVKGQGQPPVSPFFFLCNYHGNGQEIGGQTGEVKLMAVRSSLNFDGFILTGLYTISSPALQQMQALAIQGGQPVGQNLMCSIVHTHISPDPVHEFRFMWIAPPSGTGCVSFL